MNCNNCQTINQATARLLLSIFGLLLIDVLTRSTFIDIEQITLVRPLAWLLFVVVLVLVTPSLWTVFKYGIFQSDEE